MRTKDVLAAAESDRLLVGTTRRMILETLETLAKTADESGFVVVSPTELADIWGMTRPAASSRISATARNGYLVDTGDMINRHSIYEMTVPTRDQNKPVLVPVGELESDIIRDLLRRVARLEDRVRTLEGR